ncbi:hypothetical protein AUK11_01310 [bacterium CG2_30_37_16]|nr:MAG: hypothetical protein AUK11_01310 [bacterium CG2_30_37_16]PIX99074.1 MAG: hypothetical protein COZ22_03510 [bacterium (Candidatus Howlettbacteria) CG_4_10_14_3_um_filter_37_10]PJB05679.1 MAG: hypothetical protein CO123_03510 [bacterium (Candidatus Howlettbacteria) CG_4_9_14_3_um_filter_37_10]
MAKISFKGKKLKITSIVVGAAVLLVIVAVGVMALGIYKYHWKNKVVDFATEVVPYPAIKVNGDTVTVKEYNDKLNAIVNFQKEAKKVDFNSTEGKKTYSDLQDKISTQLIEDLIIGQFAGTNGIKVSTEDVNNEYKRLEQANGGEAELKKVLANYYKWSIQDFKNQIYYTTLRQKVAEKITGDDSQNKEAKDKATQILAEVKADPSKFGDLAKKYSMDSSAANGGDLGYFGKGKMVKEFEDAAFALRKDEISGIVKTVYGYHIIQVTDIKDKEIKARHILIKGKSFQDWLDAQKKNADIKKYLF